MIYQTTRDVILNVQHTNIFFLGKDYPIQASTRDEMLVWISAIEEAKVRVVHIVMLPYHPFPF